MTTDYALAREHMVLSQLQPSGVVTPRVLDAFMAVPRELFASDDTQDYCYSDDVLPLPGGRVLIEPMVLAKMIEAAEVQSTDHVLCIGGATGYGAAILAHLAEQVVDLEADDLFGVTQRDAIDSLGIGNILRVIGNFQAGAAAKGPYDVILVEGAMVNVPAPLLSQLKPDGRLLVPVVPERARVGQVTLYAKSVVAGVSSRPLFDAWLPYLPGCAPIPRFAFN